MIINKLINHNVIIRRGRGRNGRDAQSEIAIETNINKTKTMTILVCAGKSQNLVAYVYLDNRNLDRSVEFPCLAITITADDKNVRGVKKKKKKNRIW